MKMLVFLTTLLSTTAFSKVDKSNDIDRIYIEPFFKNTHSKKKSTNTGIGIRYQRRNSEITHKEQSSSSEFHSLGDTTKTAVSAIGVELSHEFFERALFFS